MNVVDEKRALRRDLRAALDAVSADEKARAGRAVAALLAPLLAAVRPGPVAAFASTARELDTAPVDDALRAAAITRLLPRINGDTLVFHVVPPDRAIHTLARDAHGIPTPDAAWPAMDLAPCPLVLVPGCAFADDGARIGFGRGYYDRVLGALARAPRPVVLGVALDVQRVPHVPSEPHDVRVDALVTPSGFAVFAALPAEIESAISGPRLGALTPRR